MAKTTAKTNFDAYTVDASVGTVSNLRGFSDFGNLKQFNLFETGNGVFAVINTPYFMNQNEPTAELDKEFKNALESEFKGIDGLGNIESDVSEISDGITTMELITKVTEQGSTTITINVKEKVGRLFTKYQEAYLRGIRDPHSHVATYNGFLDTKAGKLIEPGFQYEVFNFLYYVPDKSWKHIEMAYVLLNAQLTTANLSDVANSQKGTYEFVDIPLEFRCLPVRGKAVNKLAAAHLKQIRPHLELDSANFNWSISGLDVGKNNITIDKVVPPTSADYNAAKSLNNQSFTTTNTNIDSLINNDAAEREY